MRRMLVAAAVLAGLLTAVALPARGEDKKSADDFLAASNWEGLTEYWKVSGDTVVGATPPDQGLKFNTFLCSKKKYQDFELSFQVRLKGGVGNSGVQIRSRIHDMAKYAVTGPQCDIGAGYWGSLYGENFGGMMKQSPAAKVKEVVKNADFNDYAIRCRGKHVTITINGEQMVDGDFPKMPDEGIIAWQLHAGPPMEVTFRNIKFREVAGR
jgi:hypothetical protein